MSTKYLEQNCTSSNYFKFGLEESIIFKKHTPASTKYLLYTT